MLKLCAALAAVPALFVFPAWASDTHPECGQAIHIDEDKASADQVSKMFGGAAYTYGLTTDKDTIAKLLVFGKSKGTAPTGDIDSSTVATLSVTNWGDDKGTMFAAFGADGCYLSGYVLDHNVAGDPVDTFVAPPSSQGVEDGKPPASFDVPALLPNGLRLL
jgi:hypothetical protein